MGIDNISTLFEAAGQGRLRLHTAGLSYTDNNEQVLKFTGWHADGTPFAFVSAPFASDPHTRAIQVAHDLIVAHTGKPAPMSLIGKLSALTERAQDFTKATGDGFDALAAKITDAEAKRDTALQKHHAYYDAIGKGIDETITVIDRLANSPLGESGG